MGKYMIIPGLNLDNLDKRCYNSSMENIVTPNKFALLIENIVKEKRISYMDAILSYCDKNIRRKIWEFINSLITF